MIIVNPKVVLSSWKVESFEGSKLVLRLNITNPIEVSQAERNTLLIQIIKPQSLETKRGGSKLADDSKIMLSGIQK